MASPAVDTHWTAKDSPYTLPNDVTIPEGVTLTLEPCTVLKLADGVSINVSGKLLSAGVQGKPVTIEAIDPAKPWAWIDAARTKVRPPLDFSYTVIDSGGKVNGYPEQSATIRVRADLAGLPTPMIKVDHLEIKNSASIGISAFEASAFADGSQALTITGSKLEPVVTNILGLASFPDGNLVGNGDDVIGITAGERLGVIGQTVSSTMHKRSVPYRIGTFGDSDSALFVTPASAPDASTLTIDPGTTIRFVAKQGFDVEAANDQALGAIIAKGTAAEPITFTAASATPVAGDWLGIRFRGNPTADTALDFVVIEFAGDPDTTVSGFSCGTPTATNMGTIKGGLAFATSKAVTRQILTNSIVRDSGSNGVDRGWSSDTAIDYMVTNTFARIANCAQTQNRDAMSVCPANPSCPAAP